MLGRFELARLHELEQVGIWVRLELINDESYLAWDDVKDKPIIASEVAKARQVEIEYVGKHKVYEYASTAQAYQRTQTPGPSSGRT